MKKFLLLLILLFITFGVYAQKWTIPADIVRLYIADDKIANIDNLDLFIAIEETQDNFYKFIVTYADSTPTSFQLKPPVLCNGTPCLNFHID